MQNEPNLPRKKVTSQDVARLAGVSRTTVSMVLNQSTAVSISAETRARVLDAAASLQYTPNSVARMLQRGNTETIGLVISRPELMLVDGYIPQVLYGVDQVSRQHHYRVLLEGLEERANGRNAYLELVEGRRIDGLIVLNPRTDDAQLRELIDQQFPLVVLGTVRHPAEHAVNFTVQECLRQAVQHLVALGHHRIGHITFSAPGTVSSDARLASFRRVLQGLGLPIEDTLVAYGDFSAESGEAAMHVLLAQPNPPTAILAGNDTIAFGAMAAARQRGLLIPQDLAIIGFDDLPLASYATPPLTTIHTPGQQQGARAAEMLIQLMRGTLIEPQRIEMPATLVIRQSCGAAIS